MNDLELKFISAFTQLAHEARRNEQRHGWPEGSFPERIALIHSEVSEAFEAWREGNPPSEHVPEISAIAEELADVVIRVMTLDQRDGLGVARAICLKMAYNAARPIKHASPANPEGKRC